LEGRKKKSKKQMAEIPYFPTAPVMVLVGKLASEKLDFLEGRLKAG